jgi:hypothetical protein
MAGPIDRLRNRLGRIAADPEALLQRVKALVGQKPGKGEQAGVRHRLDEVVEELQRLDAQTVVAYGDVALREQLQSAFGKPCGWASHRAADLQCGALDVRSPELRDADAVVIGGKELKLAYANLLRVLSGADELPRILWIGEGFEFCFSTLPVPSFATHVDIYLHNHFDAYFALRDPLLLTVRASDGVSMYEAQRIVGPRETIHLTLDELLPKRNGAAFVELYTSHPTLTRGRHHRWRLCADVYWGDSFTTLHGAHDEGPDRFSQSRFSTTLIDGGELVVTVPNYGLSTAAALTKYEPGSKSKVERSARHPVEEITYRGATHGHYGYEYMGHGTSFYFGKRRHGERQVLFGNHESTIAQQAPGEPMSADRRAALDAIEQRNIMLLPHALPVLRGPVELGFSFAAATPTIDQYIVHAYDSTGSRIGTARLRDPLQGPLFADRILELLNLDRTRTPELLVIGPDWRALDRDPATFNMAGELVARHRESGDFDVTEFQSCWRNLSSMVDEFPHWIAPPNALLSRTRLVARAVHRGSLTTGLVMVHASGDATLAGDARAEIHLIDPRGRAHVHELVLSPFTSRLVWLDEALADVQKLLPEGYGSLMILSPDRDLNVQLLTHDRGKQTVSLQHLWGY